MKTLKKVLAVVLALAMVLGMAVTASAGYTDAKSITYKDAVDVMSLAGVLNGYTDGSFKPNGTLTRAEAAKMIVYALALEDTSLGYKANFGDINGHWAETPISVAAGLGIVAGMGNGMYEPNGTLTGFQWAKIILCAMGYDAEIEGMLGAGWEAKVASLAKNVKMVKGMKNFDGSKAVTREEAAQMIYNVLETGFVGYPESGTKAVTLGDRYYTGRNAKYGEKDSFFIRLGFKDVVKTNDAWGRPAKKYAIKKNSVTIVATPDASYTVATAQKDIYADLGLEETTNFTVYENGVEQDDKQPVAKKETSKVGAQGQLVEFYADDEVEIIIDTYLAKVTTVVEEKTDKKDKVVRDDYLKLSVAGLSGTYYVAGNDYEKDDYLLVNVNKESDNDVELILANNAKAQNVTLVEVVGLADSAVEKCTGLHRTSKGVVESAKVGSDTEYTKFACQYATKECDLGEKYTFFFDQYDNIIGVADKFDEDNYAVIDRLWKTTSAKGEVVYKADLMPVSGDLIEDVTVGVVDGAVVAGITLSSHAVSRIAKDNTYYYNCLVNYSVDEDDEYFLSCYSNSPSVDSRWDTFDYADPINGEKYMDVWDGASKDTVVLTEDTLFLVQTKVGPGATYKQFVGYDEIPTLFAEDCEVVFGSDGKAEVVYLFSDFFNYGTNVVIVLDEIESDLTEEVSKKTSNVYTTYKKVYGIEDEEFDGPLTITCKNCVFPQQGIFKVTYDEEGYVIDRTIVEPSELDNDFTLSSAKSFMTIDGVKYDITDGIACWKYSVKVVDGEMSDAQLTYLGGVDDLVEDKAYETANYDNYKGVYALGEYLNPTDGFKLYAVIEIVVDEYYTVEMNEPVAEVVFTYDGSAYAATAKNGVYTVNDGAVISTVKVQGHNLDTVDVTDELVDEPLEVSAEWNWHSWKWDVTIE